MTDTDAANKVELAQKHINYQRQRIVHQKELIAQLKRDHKTELLPAAHELLKDLEYALAGMMAESGKGATTDLKSRAEGVVGNARHHRPESGSSRSRKEACVRHCFADVGGLGTSLATLSASRKWRRRLQGSHEPKQRRLRVRPGSRSKQRRHYHAIVSD